MRRIIAFNNVSVDGYFAAADGGLEWFQPDPEIESMAAGPVNSNDNFTILFGRRTYDQFESFWPNVVSDSATSPDPHQELRESPEMRGIALKINDASKVVFSESRKDVSWKNSRILREINRRDIEQLKQQNGVDIMIFGSGSVTSQLTDLALIDEYQFAVNPLFLGSGQSLIRDASPLKLKLIEARPLTSGNVMLRYSPAG